MSEEGTLNHVLSMKRKEDKSERFHPLFLLPPYIHVPGFLSQELKIPMPNGTFNDSRTVFIEDLVNIKINERHYICGTHIYFFKYKLALLPSFRGDLRPLTRVRDKPHHGVAGLVMPDTPKVLAHDPNLLGTRAS